MTQLLQRQVESEVSDQAEGLLGLIFNNQEETALDMVKGLWAVRVGSLRLVFALLEKRRTLRPANPDGGPSSLDSSHDPRGAAPCGKSPPPSDGGSALFAYECDSPHDLRRDTRHGVSPGSRARQFARAQKGAVEDQRLRRQAGSHEPSVHRQQHSVSAALDSVT